MLTEKAGETKKCNSQLQIIRGCVFTEKADGSTCRERFTSLLRYPDGESSFLYVSNGLSEISK
jgi:hypothetical protein